MNTSDFRKNVHDNMINNEHLTNSLGYYVEWQLVQVWLTPPTVVGWSKSLLRKACKDSPEFFTQWWKNHIDAKTPLAFVNRPIVIRDLVHAVQQTLFDALKAQFPGCTANPKISFLCSEYANKSVEYALRHTIEYSELLDIDTLRLLYNRADMIPIEIIRKRLYRFVEASDEQLDEILKLAENLCN